MGDESDKDEEIGSATQSVCPTMMSNTLNTTKDESADEASDDEEQGDEEQGDVITKIINRVAMKEFTLVLPSQQNSV